MHVLRSIDPITAEMKEFTLEGEGAVLIGRLSWEKIPDYEPELFLKVPENKRKGMLGEVLRVRGSITMRECGIDHRPISRLHCIVFPGKNAKVMDLFSTNGTAIARLGGGGGILEPGIRVDLYPGDILLLAKGLALFQYLAVAEEEGKPPDEENGVLPFGTVSPRYPRLLPRDH